MNLLTKQKETQKMNLWLLGCGWWVCRGRRGNQGLWDGPVHTVIYKMDNHQGPTHGTLLPVMCQPDGSGVWGRMDTFLCMAESLCCSSETITTLLISYTPVQNIFGVKKTLKF